MSGICVWGRGCWKHTRHILLMADDVFLIGYHFWRQEPGSLGSKLNDRLWPPTSMRNWSNPLPPWLGSGYSLGIYTKCHAQRSGYPSWSIHGCQRVRCDFVRIQGKTLHSQPWGIYETRLFGLTVYIFCRFYWFPAKCCALRQIRNANILSRQDGSD